jgi:hypothetical protein
MNKKKNNPESFYRQISKAGRTYMIIVPKELIDSNILEIGKVYKITVEEIDKNEDEKEERTNSS